MEKSINGSWFLGCQDSESYDNVLDAIYPSCSVPFEEVREGSSDTIFASLQSPPKTANWDRSHICRVENGDDQVVNSPLQFTNDSSVKADEVLD